MQTAVFFVFAISLVSGLDVALQNVINTASYLSKNTGISLGVSTPDRDISIAAGYKNRQKSILLEPNDRMGVGSGTKMFTASAVLKAVEEGKIKLDDVALPYVDILMRKMTARSLVQYLGPQMRNVTVRHLVHMTSGIGDFDSTALRMEQINNPQKNMDMNEVFGKGMELANAERTRLWQNTGSDNSFNCAPGTCGEYSSTNYLILGIMLAQLSGAKHWKQFDQSAFLPMNLRKKMPRTVFPIDGECTSFTDVHGYMTALGIERTPLRDGHVIDNSQMNCNTGFTVANALTTGKESSIFLRALLGKEHEILQPSTIAEMTKLRWLETGLGNKVSVGQFYGMGLRDVSAQLSMNPAANVLNPEIFASGLLIGHDGMSTGWNSFSAYAPKRDFALSFLMNYNLAATFYNFISRKSYDIISAQTKPVDNPLQPTYENKEVFVNQKLFRVVKNVFSPGSA